MGHIVFGAPGCDRYHLHNRLRSALRQRGHRVSVLTLDAAAHTFWRQQLDHGEVGIAPEPPATADRQQLFDLLPTAPARTSRHLASQLGPLRRWFAAEQPELLLLHQQRGPTATVLQFLAREQGCRVLWTGDGLLPHTLQLDERGLDGDAAASQRPALDYRVVRGEPELLQACLAHALARNLPVALTPTEPQSPSWRRRLHDLPAMWRSHGPGAALRSYTGWRASRHDHDLTTPGPTAWLPPSPFVAVLLQRDQDDRVRFDAGAAPSIPTLLAAATAAARAVDPALTVAAIAATEGQRPPAGLDPAIHWLPTSAAIDAAAIAAATLTVNHPLASVALLAGTPVLHCGRALYGLRGVGTQAPLEHWPQQLARALQHDHPTLRQRFLSWVFGYGHLWCSGTHPDHNGLIGLVQAIEARLAAPPNQAPLRYRVGPAWPLTAGRSH